MQTYKLITATTFNAENDADAKVQASEMQEHSRLLHGASQTQGNLYNVSAPDMPGGREVL